MPMTPFRTPLWIVASAATFLCASAYAQEDYTGAQLAGKNFSGKRLLNVSFKQANLEGADFRNAILRGADFSGAALSKSNFRQADVRGANFSGAMGLGADPNAFRNALYSDSTTWPSGFAVKSAGAWLTAMPKGETSPANQGAPAVADNPPSEAKAEATVMVKPQTNGSVQATTSISTGNYPPTGAAAVQDKRPPCGVNEEGKDVSKQQHFSAYLNGANYNAAKIHYAIFKDCSLQGATFKAADVVNTTFIGSDLRGADFSAAIIERINLAGANCDGAIFKGCTLHLNGWSGYFKAPNLNPDLKYSYEMKEAIATAASERIHNAGLTFKGTDLRGARIYGNLANVSFRKSDLRGADLLETEGGQPEFFRGARYDDNTVWWKGFDPVAAGMVKLPVDTTVHSLPKADTKNTVTDASGVAGYLWLMKVASTGDERVLCIYADGTYSWQNAPGQIAEGNWIAAADGKGVVLDKGPGDQKWTVSIKTPEEVEAVSAKGEKLKGKREKAIK